MLKNISSTKMVKDKKKKRKKRRRKKQLKTVESGKIKGSLDVWCSKSGIQPYKKKKVETSPVRHRGRERNFAALLQYKVIRVKARSS